jgi:RNA polymerase sigma-70 factor (ECF subfamily)
LQLTIPCTILRDKPDGEVVDERDLIRRVRASDVEAFRELFTRYQPVVFRYALFRTHDADTAHDIVQETFVRIWETRERLRPDLSFLALALRISGNLVLDAVRHRQMRERLRDRIPRPALSERDDPEEAARLSALQEQLRRVLNDELGEKCRTVFLLSRFERMSNREIAGMLRIRKKTVENQISHALKVLRKRLEG